MKLDLLKFALLSSVLFYPFPALADIYVGGTTPTSAADYYDSAYSTDLSDGTIVLLASDPIESLAVENAPVADPVISSKPLIEGDFNGAVQLLSPIAKAVQDGNYLLAVALVLVLATFIVRTFLWKSIPTKWIPLVMPISAGVAVFAVALQMHREPLGAFVAGLQAGFAAVGINQAWHPIKEQLKAANTPEVGAPPAAGG